MRLRACALSTEGGERRIDVIEFICIARAIGTAPIRLFKALVKRIG